jgi:ABC-type Zn uptake system ZnuABC Zn-binding protein ZnuA
MRYTILFLLVLLVACGQESADSGRLNVVATVSPITNIVYNIAGDTIDLTGVVPEGTNSHTFEPAPSIAVSLSQADLIFINGLNLELPTLSLAEANLKEGAEIILLGEQAITPDEYVYDFSFPETEGNPNPHLWTDPLLALEYATIVRDTLVARDPDNADTFNSNYAAYADQLRALDVAIAATTATIPAENRKLLTYHDSFAYFAPHYGFEVIGAIQPADFSEPSAQDMIALINQLQAEQVPAIFGSEVFPSPILDQIGREAGVEYVDTLRDDDLPGAPGDDNHSLVGLMVENVQTMARALGGDPSLMDGVDTANIPGADSNIDQKQ